MNLKESSALRKRAGKVPLVRIPTIFVAYLDDFFLNPDPNL
jgi:hypothetical protein